MRLLYIRALHLPFSLSLYEEVLPRRFALFGIGKIEFLSHRQNA